MTEKIESLKAELRRYPVIEKILGDRLLSAADKPAGIKPKLVEYILWWSRRDQMRILNESLPMLEDIDCIGSLLDDLMDSDYANYSSAASTIEVATDYRRRYGTVEFHPPIQNSTRCPDFRVKIRREWIYFEIKSPQLSTEEKALHTKVLHETVGIPDFGGKIKNMIHEALGKSSNPKISGKPQIPPDQPGIFVIDLRYSFGKDEVDVEQSFFGPTEKQAQGIFQEPDTGNLCAVITIEDSWKKRRVMMNPNRNRNFRLQEEDI